MVSFDSVLAGDVAGGSAPLDDPAPIEELVAAAIAADWRLFHLDGAVIDSKEAFLEACSQAFGFPDWAGRNWDALADLLTDTDILDPAGVGPSGYAIVCDHVERLEVADPRAAAVAADILDEAAQHWSAKDIPFVILHRQPPAL